ncbi:hypothetical protein Hanom_Chr17g01548701 [Helianthus anomalus]
MKHVSNQLNDRKEIITSNNILGIVIMKNKKKVNHDRCLQVLKLELNPKSCN